MSEREAVLFANEAFYQAFNERDAETMAQLWARRAPVACIHPGWPPLEGREAVLRSWRSILGNPDQPPLRMLEPRVYLAGEAAFVICYEAIAGQYLVATNVFVREDGAWRLAHHQSGPTNGRPGQAGAQDDTSRTRH
jgi:ketosteroid isomerase-like protein